MRYLLILLAAVSLCAGPFFFGQQGALSVGAPAAFNPNDYGTVDLWVAARKETGLSDGDAVSTATDWGALEKNLVQATEAAKPTYKTGILNGQPVYRFDGVDDFFAAASALGVSWKTSIVVAKYSAATFSSYPGLLSSSISNEGQCPLQGNPGSAIFYNTALQTTTYWKDDTSYIESNMQAPMNAFGVVVIQRAAGWNSGAQVQVGKDRTFAGRFWVGDVAEVIYFREELDSTARLAVTEHLRTLYATP